MIRTEHVELPCGQPIAVRTRGASAETPAPVVLLCLHGMPGRGADFDLLLCALAEDWRSLAPVLERAPTPAKKTPAKRKAGGSRSRVKASGNAARTRRTA